MYTRSNDRGRKWKKFAVIFMSSVLFNVLLIALGWLMAQWLEWGKPTRDLTYRQFQVTLEPEKEEEVEKRRQVVAIPKPEKEETPDQARFSSEYDSKVEKETQAREKRVASEITSTYSPKERPSVTPRAPSPQDDRKKTHRDIEKELKPPPSALSMRKQPTDLEDPDLRVDEKEEREREDKEEETEEPAEKKVPGEESEKGKKLELSDLKLSDKRLAEAIGAPFPDHLGDVPEGDKTLLNTKRWKFSSFFNRVKMAVAQEWQPAQVYRRHDPTGKIYGFRRRLTVLKVTLDKDGAIKKVLLNRPCGLSFLDDEAVRAFKAAGPFHNPPSRLVDPKTNTIVFSFGFLFEIKQSPSFRIFRYK